MRTYAPFAVFCLSLAVAAQGATLVEVRDPAKVQAHFSADAPLRLLNVWATWCVPCVEEMSDLNALHAQFGGRLAMIGVPMDDMIPGDRAATRRKVASFLDHKHVSYTNLYYSGNSDALAGALRFSGEIPVTIVYDRSGREVWRQQGRLDRQKAIEAIQKLLRSRP